MPTKMQSELILRRCLAASEDPGIISKEMGLPEWQIYAVILNFAASRKPAPRSRWIGDIRVWYQELLKVGGMLNG